MLKYYIITIAAMSVLTVIAFAVDKIKSKGDNSRIPEMVLLSLISFGGAVGGLIGMYVLRHKTNAVTKFHFAVTEFAALAVQIYLFIMILGGASHG